MVCFVEVYYILRIAICDDNTQMCSQLEDIILQYRETTLKQIEVCVFYSGESLFNFFADGEYFDLVFLDIELSTLNGVAVGEKIRSELGNETTQIVYISGKDSYAMALFETRPLNFLLKPIEPYQVIKEIEKVIKISAKCNDFFEVKNGRSIIKLPLNQIMYFESNGRKICLTATDQKYDFYGKLSDIKEQLSNSDFISIHKSYFVNYLYISQYHYNYVVMSNKVSLHISQSHRNKVRDIVLKREK